MNVGLLVRQYRVKGILSKFIFIFCCLDLSVVCAYKKLKHTLAVEGPSVGDAAWGTQKKCERICDSRRGCNSFAYNAKWKQCWFKTLKVSGSEEQSIGSNAYTVYKTCRKRSNRGIYKHQLQELRTLFIYLLFIYYYFKLVLKYSVLCSIEIFP